MVLIRLIVMVGVMLVYGQVCAQEDFGCGTIEPDIEGGCMLFCPFTGGQYMLDGYGDFLYSGDTVHVFGTRDLRRYCGTWPKDYISGVTITLCGAVASCCVGRVGDANGSGNELPTIGDISVMIDALFITGSCEGVIDCLAEADIDQSGGCDPSCEDITIGDISTLIDYAIIMLYPPLQYPQCLTCP